MAEFWKCAEIKRELGPGENRYHVYFDNMAQTWNIVDKMQVPPGTPRADEVPEDAYIAIPQRVIRSLIKELADTKLMDHVLADKTYQKDVEERHLDIIEKLIDE